MPKFTYPFPLRLDAKTAAALEAHSGRTDLYKAQIVRLALRKYLMESGVEKLDNSHEGVTL